MMVVGLPGEAKMEPSIFWTVLKSIKIIGSYVGNRQDAVEAIELASQGKIKCFYETRPLDKLQE